MLNYRVLDHWAAPPNLGDRCNTLKGFFFFARMDGPNRNGHSEALRNIECAPAQSPLWNIHLHALFFELTFLPAPTFGLPPVLPLSPVRMPGRYSSSKGSSPFALPLDPNAL